MAQQNDISLKGGCLCGKVRFAVSGLPKRTGICHCLDCRRTSGSAFAYFSVWPRANFSHTGKIETFVGRSFCPACGSRLFSLRDDEAEIMDGAFDEVPHRLEPQYEVWVKRRSRWLPQLEGAVVYDEDRE